MVYLKLSLFFVLTHHATVQVMAEKSTIEWTDAT